MEITEVQDVLTVSALLEHEGGAGLIAALIDWKYGQPEPPPIRSAPKAKGTKATKPEPSPDPSDDPGF